MANAFNLLAVEDVVRGHLDPEHLVHKQLHHVRIVVDTLEEYGLVSYHNPGFGEHVHGSLRLGGNHFGVVFFQHAAKCRRDSLGQDARHP